MDGEAPWQKFGDALERIEKKHDHLTRLVAGGVDEDGRAVIGHESRITDAAGAASLANKRLDEKEADAKVERRHARLLMLGREALRGGAAFLAGLWGGHSGSGPTLPHP